MIPGTAFSFRAAALAQYPTVKDVGFPATSSKPRVSTEELTDGVVFSTSVPSRQAIVMEEGEHITEYQDSTGAPRNILF